MWTQNWLTQLIPLDNLVRGPCLYLAGSGILDRLPLPPGIYLPAEDSNSSLPICTEIVCTREAISPASLSFL